MQSEIDDKFKNIDKFKDDLYRKKERLIKDEKELEAIKTKSSAEVNTSQYLGFKGLIRAQHFGEEDANALGIRSLHRS